MERKILERLADRLVSLVCPQAVARAAPYCEPVARCETCGFVGSMQRFRWRQTFSNCHEYRGPCLVNNAGCAVR